MNYNENVTSETQKHKQQSTDLQVESDGEYDRYKDNPDLLNASMPKSSRLFSFDWASGYISPFRPTPQDTLKDLFGEIEFNGSENDSIIDLGCGDGLVLLQALRTFPKSQLKRSIGVDLDKVLLEASREKILREQSEESLTNDFPILSRLELYHGDLLNMDDPLSPILTPASISEHGILDEAHCSIEQATMGKLLQECSHLFVYLLPEAIQKLSPLLLESLKQGKVILSMRWEIPELNVYQIKGGPDFQYYVYSLENPQ